MIDPASISFSQDVNGERYTAWVMSLPTEWRKYISSKERPYRESIVTFHTLYVGYQKHEEKMKKVLRDKSDIHQSHYVCDIDDANFDNLIIRQTQPQEVKITEGAGERDIQRFLFDCMNKCLLVKKKLVELSDEIAVDNGKPATLSLKKWLSLHEDVRRQIKREPAKAFLYLINRLHDSEMENERFRKENISLIEESKSFKSWKDDFHKLQKRNFEIQKDRAKEVDELDCVKRQLDKVKQDANRLWKEKEHYRSVLSTNNIYELRSRIEMEHTKVLELTKKYQEISKEREQLLTRLSEVAGTKLTSNNPAITDLSDENRPLKLAEKFSQMYDDDWTDSLEEIAATGIDEETSIRFLLHIVMTAFELCSKSQFAFLDLNDCQTVIWCDANVKHSVLHETKLSDAAKLNIEPATKEYRYAGRKDLISTMQMRFQIVLKGMLCDLVRKHNFSRASFEKPQLNQLEVQGNGGKRRENGHHNDSENSTEHTMSAECKSRNNKISDGESWVFSRTFPPPKLRKEDAYRLTGSARGDFLEPCYERYKEDGFSLEKEEVEKLFLAPMKRKTPSENTLEDFPKTSHFAKNCVEVCWLMHLIQPPVHLSARIPENKERKQDVFKAYTKSGQMINYVVWPAMYLHKDGPLLSKGVAQPK